MYTKSKQSVAVGIVASRLSVPYDVGSMPMYSIPSSVSEMSIDRSLLPAAQAELTQLLHQFFCRLGEFPYEVSIALMEQDALWHRPFQFTVS